MQEVFKRYEKKYMLDVRQYQALLDRILPRLKPDAYGQYTICNIYYDTPEYALIRHSIEKPVYKEKLRLRSYGVPGAEDTVFLELKKKYDGIVYKRRVALSLAEAEAYLAKGVAPSKQGQIMEELNWFTSRYFLQPAVYLAYDRIAYQCREDANLRMTFDTGIRCREQEMGLGAGDAGKVLLPKDQVLMEIKIPGVMPLWLARTLSELQIYPASFSKYGTFYMEKQKQQQQQGPVVIPFSNYLHTEQSVRRNTIC